MGENPAGLNKAAMQALAAGDFATAQALLLRLVAADPASIPGWLNLAAVRRRLNDVDGAFAALREVMRLEPRNFPALLMSATLLEREGQMKAAAECLRRRAFQRAAGPVSGRADAPGRRRTRAKSTAGTRASSTISSARTSATRRASARRPSSGASRRSSTTTLRIRKRYQQEPLEYYFPGLPAIEFYERAEFPWLEELEAATEPMQRELAAILREDQAGFAPYIHYDDHMPLDQWRELNHSPRWSAFHFYEKGQPIAERCNRAPATMQVLSRLPQAHVPLRSPSAMFSVLQPHTRIPPHTGIANFRLVVHLPLIVPPGCGFRVGGETRQWRIGEAWVFDDTIEHEAWNDSDQTRIIFICDVWSPRLSPDERAAIGQVIAATDAFNGTQPSSSV